MTSNMQTVGGRALAATLLAVALTGTAVAKQRTVQVQEGSSRTRTLPAAASRSILTAASSNRVCETGAKWIRLDFRSLKLHAYDSLVLKSSGGDRYVFQGGHWNNRSFSSRALRGSCVDIQPYFASRDSGYELGGYTVGTRALAQSAVVVAGAGDICDSTTSRCAATSDLIVAMNPDAVFTAGDNAYDKGTLEEYNTLYDPNWGRFKSKTKPTPGNHDYYSSSNYGTGYFDYFNGKDIQSGLAGDRSMGYYSWDVGDWHFVAMNTMTGATIAPTSDQVTWLKQDLAANTKPCTAAYFHHPLISLGNYTPESGKKYSYEGVKALYDALYAAKADLVLVGHDHNYQRFIKMNPNLESASDGFVQVLVGTGGRIFYPVPTANRTNALLAYRPNSTTEKAVSASTYGVLKLTLTSTGYTGEFVRATNSGNGNFGSSTRPENFTGTCNKASTGTTYSVSGTIATSGGTGISGVSVSNGSTTVTTNASGLYTFSGLANGTYTLTPSLSGYTFSPTSLSATVSSANVTGRNFTGTSTSPGGNTLSKGVAVTGLGATAGNWLDYTMAVPSGATNLTFKLSGGSANQDADMYVKFGGVPSDGNWDCVSERSDNAETCTFAIPQAGTYHVRIKAYSTFSGVSLVGDYTAGSAGAQTYSNGTDVAISDKATVTSSIVVSGRTGYGSATTPIAVNIAHTYIGDLKVELVAPSGTAYVLHNYSGGTTDNINKTYSLDLSGQSLNGTWLLRVNDKATDDTGKIDSWSITF